MMHGLYCYSKGKLGVRVERKQVPRKPVRTDRCLEGGDYLKGGGGIF
jgi:hypothetical protein